MTVPFQRGNASRMPFGNETFDYIVCRAAFKNFSEPVAAIEEMYRVLKPDGRALIIDLRRDAGIESINKAVENMRLSPVNRLVTKLTFRFMLLKRAYTKEEFETMAAQTRFGKAELHEDGIGFEVSLKKN